MLTLSQWFPRHFRSFQVRTWTYIVRRGLLNFFLEQTHKNGQYTTVVVVILSRDSVECLLRDLHRDSLRVHLAATRLKGEMSPEDLFNMFFGGGSAFSTGPGDILCNIMGLVYNLNSI